MQSRMTLLVCLAPALLVWLWPEPMISVLQQRVLGIFVLAGLLWILEPVPVHATSMLILFLLLVMASDQAPWPAADALPYADIMASLASPVIVLFLGGFALAVAAAATGVDRWLAVRLLRPFSSSPQRLLWGIFIITALFSMFLSNTATSILMLSMLTSLFPGVPVPRRLVLAVPVAANVGGIGTPIGTPPNAIALQYLSDLGVRISFLEWMAIGLPVVAALMWVGVWLLSRQHDTNETALRFPEQRPQIDQRGRRVMAIMAITVLLWLSSDAHGMNAYVVSVFPLTVLPLLGLLGREELRRFDWDVIWLVAGGIALGRALETSGLADVIIHTVLPDNVSILVTAFSLMLIAWMMANVMSNTSTANLVLPLAAAAAGEHPWVLVVVAMSTSLGMMLPISTPPNSIAYATGRVDNHMLMRAGAVIAAAGILLLVAFVTPLVRWML